MPVSQTGFANLPDIGLLFYNGITFSSLYKSEISGPPIQDEARRTTKYVEYTLVADGVVTLNPGERTTDDAWVKLRKQLSVHGGTLAYSGKGFGQFVVNQPGGSLFDVAFGPVPKVLSFQPMGASRSALIKWQCVIRIPELPTVQNVLRTDGYPRIMNVNVLKTFGAGGGQGQTNLLMRGGKLVNNQIAQALPGYVLQFNYEASIDYDDDGYSRQSIRGTLEIPMTRRTVDDRTLADIVDAYRQAWLDIQVDLTKYKVTRRRFNFSRDKRTCEWEFASEELPPQGLPAYATTAGGTMSVRPAFKIPPLGIIDTCRWFVTLNATYTIRKDFPRRAAWWAFCGLMWSRMQASARGEIPDEQTPQNAPQQKPQPAGLSPLASVALNVATAGVGPLVIGAAQFVGSTFKTAAQTAPAPATCSVVLTDFGFDEGLYRDSKTVTFHVSWFLPTTMRSLFAATGVWTQPPGTGGKTWAMSVQDMMGWKSWLANRLDPSADLIVDLGGGAPPLSPPIGG